MLATGRDMWLDRTARGCAVHSFRVLALVLGPCNQQHVLTRSDGNSVQRLPNVSLVGLSQKFEVLIVATSSIIASCVIFPSVVAPCHVCHVYTLHVLIVHTHMELVFHSTRQFLGGTFTQPEKQVHETG